jgi:hypothetical protein
MLKSSSLCLYSSNLLKLLSQSQPNFAEMILRWSPFKIVSDNPALHSRWLLLLKIEISSNGQNCSIVSQRIPPFFYFELGGHLGWKSGSPDIILEGGHPRIISAKFG